MQTFKPTAPKWNRYHFLDREPVEVCTQDGVHLLGSGWLAISEEEYKRNRQIAQRLDHLTQALLQGTPIQPYQLEDARALLKDPDYGG